MCTAAELSHQVDGPLGNEVAHERTDSDKDWRAQHFAWRRIRVLCSQTSSTAQG